MSSIDTADPIGEDRTRPERQAWARAATLAERAGWPAAAADGPSPDAARKLAAWRAQAPFDDDAYWGQRLAAAGLTEAELARLLDAAAPPGPEPDWTRRLREILDSGDLADNGVEVRSEAPPGAADLDAGWAHFARPLLPFVVQEATRLRSALLLSGAEVDGDGLLPALLGDLTGLLVLTAQRTLILEINIARLDMAADGTADGDPAERFRAVLARLSEPDRVADLLAEYPVLARDLVERTDRWHAAVTELLSRLRADRAVLAGLGVEPGDRLVEVTPTGDPHRGGRRVTILGFASGARVVYKPRSLTLDVRFAELLAELGRRGITPELRVPRSLDHGRYGWQEFVAGAPCSSEAEAGDFYERHGALVAVLYLLQATDLHSENLVAAGPHPVLLDLESVLQPELAGMTDGPIRAAAQTLVRSVLRSGLLPSPAFLGGALAGLDLSGIGAAGGQQTPMPVPTVTGDGTDEIRVVHEHQPVPVADRHRPSIPGRPEVSPVEHLARLEHGFLSTYRALLAVRDELETLVLDRFAGAPLRVIVRPTATYASLLYEGSHPWLLRDHADRQRHLDLLWSGVRRNEQLATVIPAEQVDLLRGDIPVFTTTVHSHTLESGTGGSLVDALRRPAAELIRERIAALGEDDLARQLWLLRGSFATLAAGRPAALPAGARSPAGPGAAPVARPAASPPDLLRVAGDLGDRIRASALPERQGLSWLVMQMGERGAWSAGPAFLDVYGGLPGIALFLAELGRLTGEDRHTDTARSAAEAMLAQLDGTPPEGLPGGFFAGHAGVAVVLARLGMLWREPDLLARAEAELAAARAGIAADTVLDVVGGAAGLALAGLAVAGAVEDPTGALGVAVAAGEHLLARSVPAGDGIGWTTGISPEVPLGGLSHGASGFSLALGRLAAATGRSDFRDGALASLAYERGTFDPVTGTWRDLRDPALLGQGAGGEPVEVVAWCHGAPGIGLARIALLDHLGGADPRVEEEAVLALRATLRDGFGATLSACHGDLGNLETVLQAARVLGDRTAREQLPRLVAETVDAGGLLGWPAALPLPIPSPSFMIGMAGMGYQLLRLAAPDEMPSLLLLDPVTVPGEGRS